MAPQIVPATSPEQIATVAAVAEEIWREHFPSVITNEQIDYMLEKYQSARAITRQIADEEIEYYLLLSNQQNVGYFAVRAADDGLFLSKLYIRKAHRGNGHARAVVEGLIDRASGLPQRRIWLTVNKSNDVAVGAYLKMGFATVNEVCKDIGSGFVMDDYIMEKRAE